MPKSKPSIDYNFCTVGCWLSDTVRLTQTLNSHIKGLVQCLEPYLILLPSAMHRANSPGNLGDDAWSCMDSLWCFFTRTHFMHVWTWHPWTSGAPVTLLFGQTDNLLLHYHVCTGRLTAESECRYRPQGLSRQGHFSMQLSLSQTNKHEHEHVSKIAVTHVESIEPPTASNRNMSQQTSTRTTSPAG